MQLLTWFQYQKGVTPVLDRVTLGILVYLLDNTTNLRHYLTADPSVRVLKFETLSP